MSTGPEIEKPQVQPPTENVVQEIPETPEISEALQEQGVTKTPTNPQTLVNDNQVQPTTPPPVQDNAVTIQIPASPTQLHTWSQGSPASSLTWLATYWMRLIKKALLHGWNVVLKGGNK